MQISDMHIGNRFDRQFIIDSFKEAKNYKPDFVVYTGDFISYESDEQFAQLKEVFSKYYTSVIGTKIIIDPVNKISKGYGFVKFSDQNESQKALTEMNGTFINGKPIKTK